MSELRLEDIDPEIAGILVGFAVDEYPPRLTDLETFAVESFFKSIGWRSVGGASGPGLRTVQLIKQAASDLPHRDLLNQGIVGPYIRENGTNLSSGIRFWMPDHEG